MNQPASTADGAVPPRPVASAPVERAVSPRLAGLASGASTDRLWADIAETGTPLVEPDPRDHAYRTVTFVWRDRHGTGPGTRAVLVSANKVTDRADPASGRMDRVTGTDAWAASWRLRADWRGSYRIAADDGAPLTPAEDSVTDPYWMRLARRAAADPANPHRMADRWGGADLSVATLPAAPPQPWWQARPDVPAGAVAEHRLDSTALGNRRPVWVYTPPGRQPTDGPYPTLIVLDGEMWGDRMPLAATLDNLIAQRRIPPLVALLPGTLDLDTRRRELTCRPSFLTFLTDELLGWAGRHWNLSTDPRRTIIAGQSLGGLTAAYAGLRAWQRFGNVIAQSGSFWWPSGTPFEADACWLTRQYATTPARPVRIWLEAGLLEGADRARQLRDVLDARGYDLAYSEYYGGHDYACWRGSLADALVRLAGGWPHPGR